MTYLVLGSKEAFLHDPYVVFACWSAFGLVQSGFFAYKAQSPGCRAYNVYLVRADTHKKTGFFLALLRYFIFILTSSILIGLIISFFRKDKLCLHDLATNTILIEEKLQD